MRPRASYAMLAAAALSAAACRPAREVVRVTDTVVVTDTVAVTVRDTVSVTAVRYDSVDRVVERVVYTDTAGVVHEKEIERLTHHIRMQDERYSAVEALLAEKSRSEERRSETAETAAACSPTRPQRVLMGLGWCFIASAAAFLAAGAKRIREWARRGSSR